MNCKLFDEFERTDTEPRRPRETLYEHLNRLAGSEAERIRSLLEEWFSRYPEEKQADFLGRFKGKEFDRKFFELYIHEILRCQSDKVSVEPDIEEGSTHPDFLVSCGELKFYVEAIVPELPKDAATNTIIQGGASFGGQGATMIRKAIKKKATYHEELGRPYLIAINVNWSLPDNHVINALFGNSCVQVNRETRDVSHGRDFRTGKLTNPKGLPQNTRVSGLIILENLTPLGIAESTPVLWHAPCAKHPFPPERWQLPQQILDAGKGTHEKKDGKSISDLLELPPNWPEG